jgi:hypothetical protein
VWHDLLAEASPVVDPFELDGRAFQPGEVDRQLETERMGRGFVFAHEKPQRDHAIGKDGRPVALPWSTGKPMGHQMRSFTGLAELAARSSPEEAPTPILVLPLTPSEQQRLDRGAREAGTIDAVNRGVGRPETDAFNESDYLLTQDGLNAGEELVRCTRTPNCIYVAGHSGSCHPQENW